jgi:RNA polymerase sigma factor (sigma-70 family)
LVICYNITPATIINIVLPVNMPSYHDHSDAQLLLLCKQGDANAFNEIYERTWEDLYVAAHRRLKDPEVCKDIIHDVFADLWNHIGQRDIQDLLPYLHTAVRYKIYSWLGKGNSTPHFIEPYEAMATSAYTADSWYNVSELEKLIALWLDTLPAKRKLIFKLHYHDNLSTKDISEQLNISQKTVQNQLLNSVNGLKGYLTHYLTLLVIFGLIS